MKTGMLVLALTMSGALGGICGALLVQGDAPAAAPAPAETGPSTLHRGPDEAGEKALADLRTRLEVIEANLGNVVAESGRLRTELADERKAGGEARERLATLEKNPFTVNDAAGGPGAGLRAQRMGELGGRLAELTESMPVMAGMGDRFRKIGELRALPVDERWQKARDALGLTSTQEEELKSALKERDDAMKDAMKVTTQETKGTDGNSNQTVAFAMPDMEKMRESRKRYDDRVAQTLNADQAKKWKDDGYEGALGSGPGPMIATAIRVDSSTEGK